MVTYLIVMFMLIYESVIDIRYKKIDVRAAIAACIVSILIGCIFYGHPVINILYGIIFGGFLIMLAWVSKQRIGYGDAVVFMVLGMCLEPVRVLWILWSSMVMAGVYGMVKIIVFNKSRSLALPYVPFVTIVYVGMLISGI